nr:hypothetical protein [Kibdelosporangium sp. MJ126-NF4]
MEPPGESASVPSKPSPGTARQKEPDPPDRPGALGSPIDYDSTQVGARDRAPGDVKGSVESQLDELTKHCAQKRCGIKVAISGKGGCAVSLSPDPVKPRGVITVGTGSCPKEPTEPDENTPTPQKPTPSTGNQRDQP